jgi:hypothetical protein
MNDVDKEKFEPLFWDRDKNTSFLSVVVNGSEYKLGDGGRFKVYLRGTAEKPVLAFESSFLSVTEEFSFIRTASSGVTNGIRIDIKLENWGDQAVDVGSRLLVDTFLGEKTNPNFRTDLRPIEVETIIDHTTQDQWWISRNDKYGIMGSIFVEGIDPPDFLFYANWKRLYGANFKPEYVQGRNFNDMPFSVRDSAVAYYLEVKPLERWQTRKFTVLLAAEDQYGFNVKKDKYSVLNETIINNYEFEKEKPAPEVVRKSEPTGDFVIDVYPKNSNTAPLVTNSNTSIIGNSTSPRTPKGSLLLPIGPIKVDLMVLRELMYKVDEHILYGTPISEEELRGMEMSITRIKSRYGGIFSPY